MTVLCHLLSFDWFLDESSTAVCFFAFDSHDIRPSYFSWIDFAAAEAVH